MTRQPGHMTIENWSLRLDGLGDGTDLVDLEQETIASLLFNGSLDAERVGHSEIVTDDLDTTLGSEVSPRLPVILVEGVLDGDDGVLRDVAEVEVGEFDTSDPLGRVRVGVLEVKIVLSVLVKLGGCNVKSNFDLALVSGLLDRLGKEFQRFFGTRHVGGETSLITNIHSYEGDFSADLFTLKGLFLPSMPYLALMTFLRVW